METPTIYISLLGPFICSVGGRQIRFPTRGAERLLAYLLLKRGHPVPRRKLAGTLWPDSDDVRAARNLNTTLWRIRKTLENWTIRNFQFQSDQIQVSAATAATDVDLIEFQDLTANVSRLSGRERLVAMTKAEELYRGDLLEGLDDEWIVAERAVVRSQYLSLLGMLLDACLESGDYSKGLTYSERLMAADPLNEDGHRVTMLLRFFSGNRSGALVQYRHLQNILNAELGVEPSQEITDLWCFIKSGRSVSEARRQFVTIGR